MAGRASWSCGANTTPAGGAAASPRASFDLPAHASSSDHQGAAGHATYVRQSAFWQYIHFGLAFRDLGMSHQHEVLGLPPQ